MKHLLEVVVILSVVCVGLLLSAQCREEPKFFNNKEPNRIILHCQNCNENRVHYFRSGDNEASCKACFCTVNITRTLQRLESRQTEDSSQNSGEE